MYACVVQQATMGDGLYYETQAQFHSWRVWSPVKSASLDQLVIKFDVPANCRSSDT